MDARAVSREHTTMAHHCIVMLVHRERYHPREHLVARWGMCVHQDLTMYTAGKIVTASHVVVTMVPQTSTARKDNAQENVRPAPQGLLRLGRSLFPTVSLQGTWKDPWLAPE